MKIALSSTAKVNLLRATVGSTEYQSLYVGATKWWPSARVAKLAFRVSKTDGVTSNYFTGARAWGYYTHANDVLSAQAASATCCMELSVEGYVYQLKKAYGVAVVASVSVDAANDTLVVSFTKGTGPTADAVSVGTVAKLKMVAPARELTAFNVNTSSVERKYTVPWVEGMTIRIRSYYSSTGDSFRLIAEDSYRHVDVFVNGLIDSVTVTGAKTGQHSAVQVIYANDQFNDSSAKCLTIGAIWQSPYVRSFQVIPSVPAFTKTSELTVFSITKE